MKKILISLVAMVATAIIWPTFAATEITPLAAFAETSWNGRPAANAISNSGLSDGLQGTDASTMWMGSNSGNTGGASFAKWFVVDLGSVRPLGNMKVWNFNMAGYPKRGLKKIDVYVADTDAVFSGTPDFTDTATWTLSKEDLVLSMAPGSADYAGETACNFGGAEARWVGFWIDELFESSDDWAAGGGYGGLSKVKFYEYEAPAEILDPSQFTYRAPVTFPGYTASGTLDNFPVLVRLTETVGGFSYDDASADGSDIRFALEDGTVLPSEVALWNPDGESLVWVGVPSLSSGASVWLYWGKTHSFPASQTDGSVWTDAGYFAVWHMDEAVGATTTADSAGGTFDGTHVGTTPGQEGKVGRGVLISNGGWNDAADRGKGITTAAYAGKGNVFTLTSWLKYKSGQNPGTDRLISSKSAHTDTTGWEVSFQRYSPRRIDIRGSSSASAIGSYDLFPNNWMGAWQHLGVVFNGGNVAVFLNGAYKTYGSTAALVDCDRVLTIGANVGFGEDSFKGTLDEMRLRQGRSTDAWIAAEYASVNDASFAAVGAKELLDTERDIALLGAVSVASAASHSATISWVLRTASASDSATVTAYYGSDPANLSQSIQLASGANIAKGEHVSSLTGLECGTTWYAKVVATGADDGDESEVVSFTTTGSPVFGEVSHERDGFGVTILGSLVDAGTAPLAVTAHFGADAATWATIGTWSGVASARDFEASATAPAFGTYSAGFRATGTCPDCGRVFDVASDTDRVIVFGECRWTGAAGDYSWNTPGNWSSGTVPSSQDTAVFGAEVSLADSTISLDGEQAVKALVVESAGELALGSAADIEAGYGLSAAHLARSGESANGLTFSVPFSFSEPEDGTNTLVATADVRFNAALGATGVRPLLKTGSGAVTLAATCGAAFPSPLLVLEGSMSASAVSSFRGDVVVGDGNAEVHFTCTVDNAPANQDNGSVTVHSNATASLRLVNWGHFPYQVFADGGTISLSGYSYMRRVLLRGGTVSVGGAIYSSGYSSQGIVSYASSETSRFNGQMQFNGYGSATISVEDGEAPVDLVMNRNVWWGGSSSTLYKTGAGTLKWIATSGPDSGSPIQINGGTLLCDNESGTPIGNTALAVNAGATLGGTGFVGGTERGNVTVAGSSTNPGVLAPGSIDEESGAHLYGTFTVGTESQTNLVSMGACTKLVAGIGSRNRETGLSDFDKLMVHGDLSIGENCTLDLTTNSADLNEIKGGRYTIVEADKIEGTFATVIKPKNSWKVTYVSEEVEGVTVVKKVNLDIPSKGLAVIVR